MIINLINSPNVSFYSLCINNTNYLNIHKDFLQLIFNILTNNVGLEFINYNVNLLKFNKNHNNISINKCYY